MKCYVKKAAIIMLCLFSVLLSACRTEKTDVKKIKDLEYTVVEDADVPEELMKMINEKKAEAFKMTFSDEEYLYIVVGYGTKPTGGYSIAVNDLYLTSNAIYIDTDLIGPEKDEKVIQQETYPYIVIKTEYLDRSVVFQ
ncbi:MAG TPA: protease complex subunit PrcB family protein [Lachnospiraceae bacterium]|jgi:hypothetical protein|nr:protease complex subunit PrcB family protein [Lachnospiraceae bacterium]